VHVRCLRGEDLPSSVASRLVRRQFAYGRLGRPRELEEVPMSIVGGLDIHRRQLTFDYLDTETGQVRRGQCRVRAHDTLDTLFSGDA
jgi:hypothetical protein